MQGLNNLFCSQEQYLEEVVILPNGHYQIPYHVAFNPYDYQTIEIGVRASWDNQHGNARLFTTQWSPTEAIAQAGVTFAEYSTVDSGKNIEVTGNISASGVSFYKAGNGAATNTMYADVAYIKGYKKRYATQNLSKIIDVNGGNPVGVKQRYVIDIASELGDDYLDRDLIVQSEIYHENKWSDPKWIFLQDTSGTNLSQGVMASTTNNIITVKTGNDPNFGLCGEGAYTGSSFTTGLRGNAPCRVKVWKIDQFVTNTDSQEHARTYPTPWQSMVKDGDTTNLRFTGNNIRVVVGETLWRWADRETIEAKGIIRAAVSTGIVSGEPIILLPDGYVNLTEAPQYLTFGSHYKGGLNSYGQMDNNSPSIKLLGALSGQADMWTMFDWRIAVKKV